MKIIFYTILISFLGSLSFAQTWTINPDELSFKYTVRPALLGLPSGVDVDVYIGKNKIFTRSLDQFQAATAAGAERLVNESISTTLGAARQDGKKITINVSETIKKVRTPEEDFKTLVKIASGSSAVCVGDEIVSKLKFILGKNNSDQAKIIELKKMLGIDTRSISPIKSSSSVP